MSYYFFTWKLSVFNWKKCQFSIGIYRDFGQNGNYDDCNIELGHCHTSCQGEGSCEEGFYCDGGNCEMYQN